MLSRFHADIAFISTKAVSLPTGLYEMYLPLIDVKKVISANAEKVILLADHSKFSAKAMCLSIPIKDIDMVITDSGTSQEHLEQLSTLGKDYLIASMSL
jgi:DeoR/GlpR family transcriptional regulator of sugar metabolism